MAVAVAVAVAVSGGGAVAVAVAGLTKRFFNHIQKNFLINIWGYPEKGNYYFIGNTISRSHYKFLASCHLGAHFLIMFRLAE